jgi:hypothetical protein
MAENREVYPFGKYKKAKYKLYVNGEVQYCFVTTIRAEEDCVDILKEMVSGSVRKYTKSFSITKTVDGNATTLFIGSIKGI